LSSGSDHNLPRFQAVGFRFECDLSRPALWPENDQATACAGFPDRQVEAGSIVRRGTAGGGEFIRPVAALTRRCAPSSPIRWARDKAKSNAQTVSFAAGSGLSFKM
jgi:hypothetical protein